MEIRANQKGYIFDSLRGIHLDSPGYIKINCKLFEWMIFSFSSLSLKEGGYNLHRYILKYRCLDFARYKLKKNHPNF